MLIIEFSIIDFNVKHKGYKILTFLTIDFIGEKILHFIVVICILNMLKYIKKANFCNEIEKSVFI